MEEHSIKQQINVNSMETTRDSVTAKQQFYKFLTDEMGWRQLSDGSWDDGEYGVTDQQKRLERFINEHFIPRKTVEEALRYEHDMDLMNTEYDSPEVEAQNKLKTHLRTQLLEGAK